MNLKKNQKKNYNDQNGRHSHFIYFYHHQQCQNNNNNNDLVFFSFLHYLNFLRKFPGKMKIFQKKIMNSISHTFTNFNLCLTYLNQKFKKNKDAKPLIYSPEDLLQKKKKIPSYHIE